VDDPKNFPWTRLAANYQSETQDHAKYILKNKPDAKIACSFRRRLRKDYLKASRTGSPKAASMIVMEENYESPNRPIDSHMSAERTGADVFINITTPKFAAQAIKKNANRLEPLHFLNNVSPRSGRLIKPAGVGKRGTSSPRISEGSDGCACGRMMRA